VLRTARELDYRPNLTARSLRLQVSSTLALVADTIVTGSYGGELIRGSLTAAMRHSHRLLVCESEGDRSLERALIEDLLDRGVDGFIYATTSHDAVVLPRELRHQRVVLLNCRGDLATPEIVPDEVAGGRDAARLLLEAGHRDGIYVVGEAPEHSVPGRERLEGIESALAEAGATLAGRVDCAWWPEAAHDAMSAALSEGTSPGAVVCFNDRIAFGVFQALAEAGLEVPADVSVVSFDDSELASWLRPSVSSVALPEFEMGRLAVEALLAPSLTPGIQRVDMPVRARESVGPPQAVADGRQPVSRRRSGPSRSRSAP
jgi:LacI family transcriptional regulator